MSIQEEVREFFKGHYYEIVEDERAQVILLEGEPIASACIEHGSHDVFDLSCTHVRDLLKKIGYF